MDIRHQYRCPTCEREGEASAWQEDDEPAVCGMECPGCESWIDADHMREVEAASPSTPPR